MEIEKEKTKSAHAEREEKILRFWKENGIFEKSLEENKAGGKEFIFYEGPPTANGHPGIHHLEARAFKDAIPRYKTMRGFYVRRKGGWDTHGLPVELQVEKELSLKSKKEIETYGIAKFNEKCKESVWKYMREWEEFTGRMGYWVDLNNPYITYKPEYIESLWNIVKTVHEKGLLYKDYKVVPWCPRCETALSSHELAQGYEDAKDLAVTVKFKIKNQKSKCKNSDEDSETEEDGKPVYLLAWTTTPWTLPGNVALAVGEKIEYVEVTIKETGENLILAKERLATLKEEQYSIIKTFKGKELIGWEYEPLYQFLRDNIDGPEKEKLANAFKVYAADFVTIEDGTGIVHTAVMYGQDDFELGTKVGLPKYHLVNEDGTFKKETDFLAGAFVKDPNTDIAIIKDLACRGLLFAKEKYGHSYPFCWRCHTPLIYYARDSWYIKMSALRDKLVKENEGIHWEPEYIKEGRFGEWLSEVKDWAISRERYWGTPLPIWVCEKCGKKRVVGSISEIETESRNAYFVMRHGEAENNTRGFYDSALTSKSRLTEKGKSQVKDAVKGLKDKKIDLIITSPLLRTKETAKIILEGLALKESQFLEDARLRECGYGAYDGKADDEISKNSEDLDRYVWKPEGGENYADIKKRLGDFLYDIDSKYQGKTILVVTHETPALLLMAAARGLDREQNKMVRASGDFLNNAEVREVKFSLLPHNENYELDLHRPNLDQVKFICGCGGAMSRVKEVMDVWFDSGSMPFAQDHYPFENKEYVDESGYPADFISEAVDQTRGWFYTLHAVGVLMGKGKAYKNVICLGHILDAEGKKMSKSVGNVVNPVEMMDKYGADALRFWMYSVNQPGESKNFEERTVDEIIKKVFNLTLNVLAFYKLYASSGEESSPMPAKLVEAANLPNILDQWILVRLNQLIGTVTRGLDAYKFFESTRAIRDFIADFSQWYIRRSRDRFKSDNEKDKTVALASTKFILLTLSKVLAPFTPFFAEHIYRDVGGEKESVHLEEWPAAGTIDSQLLEDMQAVRNIASQGLEARMKAKINVRQPLNKLIVKNGGKKIADQLIDLIKDEVNVKEVVFNSSIKNNAELDTAITPELKEEGMFRELVREIQDLRKEKGLTVNDRVVLKIEADSRGKEFVEKFKNELKRATLLKEIKFEPTGTVGDEINIGGICLMLNIQ